MSYWNYFLFYFGQPDSKAILLKGTVFLFWGIKCSLGSIICFCVWGDRARHLFLVGKVLFVFCEVDKSAVWYCGGWDGGCKSAICSCGGGVKMLFLRQRVKVPLVPVAKGWWWLKVLLVPVVGGKNAIWSCGGRVKVLLVAGGKSTVCSCGRGGRDKMFVSVVMCLIKSHLQVLHPMTSAKFSQTYTRLFIMIAD